MAPLSHRLWFRLILVACLMIPAIAPTPYDPVHTPTVVAEVLQAPFITIVPWLLPVANIALALAAVLPFFGVAWASRILLGYYAGVLVVVAFLQNMSDTTSFGFIWLVGNTVVQLVVAVWVVIDVVQGRSRITRAQLRPGRLWLLAPMLLALLMPYTFEHGKVTPSLTSAMQNESGVTYCMITPVVLGILLIFIDGVDRRTLAVISFVGLGFGLINLVVWFGLRPQDWWMGVLHLPLAITAAFGLIESRLRGEALSKPNRVNHFHS